MSTLTYAVVLVDYGETRFLIEQSTRTFKVSFHGSCTQMVGLRFLSTRPTLVINETKHRDERYERWFEHEVKPLLTFAEYIDNGR